MPTMNKCAHCDHAELEHQDRIPYACRAEGCPCRGYSTRSLEEVAPAAELEQRPESD